MTNKDGTTMYILYGIDKDGEALVHVFEIEQNAYDFAKENCVGGRMIVEAIAYEDGELRL